MGEKILREHGWDGQKPVLALCPINPFWWPVTPDLRKTLAMAALGLHRADHYRSIYFHAGGDSIDAAQDAYLDQIAEGATTFARSQEVFVVCIGMEQLDRTACEALSHKLSDLGIRGQQAPPPVLISDTYNMFDMISALRCATYLVSSRYHAIVTSMPAGVLSVGVTMDERIANLMDDRGTPELSLTVDDPQLGRKIAQALAAVTDDADAIREGIFHTVVRNLRVMGEMGVMLAAHVQDRLPGFPLPEGRGRGGDPWAHLPPLSPALQALVRAYASDAPAAAGGPGSAP